MAQHLSLKLQKPTFKSVVKKVIRNQIVFRNESFFRDMMREELRRMREEFQCVMQYELERLIRPFLQQIQRPQLASSSMCSSESRFKLRFINTITNPIYTGDLIVANDDSPIALELIDCGNNGQRVTFGPLSSVQVEIVALTSHFVEEEWNKDEFSSNVLSQGRGKAPLLAGDVYVTLKEGFGSISNAAFTDVSSRREGGKFRLGARVVSGRASLDVHVKEAKSDAFIVKCRRLKDCDKHYPPKPDSEVWRLKHIARNGCFHIGLESSGVFNVNDLLHMYITNPTELREILNKSGKITDKTWNNIVSHALQCKPDINELNDHRGDSQRSNVSNDQLGSSQQQVLMDRPNPQAHQNIDQLAPSDGCSQVCPPRPLWSAENDFSIWDMMRQDQTDGIISVVDHSVVVISDQHFTHQLELSASQVGSDRPTTSSSSQGITENISVPEHSMSYSYSFWS